MKKKLIIYLGLFVGGAVILASCRKTFLDVTPQGQFLESNYYQTPQEAFTGLVAAYDPLGMEVGGTDNTYICPLGGLNSASDECYTGGGSSTDMNFWQVWNNYTLTPAVGPQAGYWDRNFTGLYRSNLILQKISAGVPGLSTDLQKRYIAEAKWLRAYYNFWLVRLFKNIPLLTSPLPTAEIYKVTQASPDSVYAQIERDLKEAIPDLPETVSVSENGRITRGAGNALLGKVIIYENNESRMLEAANYLEQVNNSDSYALLPNYADNFNPDKKFNSEAVFEIVHTNGQNAGWGSWPNFEGNVYCTMTGPRSYSGPTYNSGWSFNPIIPAFAAQLYGDPRYETTVADIDSITNASGSSYVAGYQNTGLFINKYPPLKKYTPALGDGALNYPNDYVEIRLADTYLLEAEALVRGGGDAAKAQSYLDKVRQRVDLPSVPATLDNIYNERKLELATEGHRWFDLVRTGKAPSVLAFKGFKTGINEVLPIPLAEINNTQLKQNNGY
ncbi:MAG: RagB/SusD family nutrient uptake outer membrane protein [Chitinophagales bacterium]